MRSLTCFAHVLTVAAVRNVVTPLTFTPGNGPTNTVTPAATACMKATSHAAKSIRAWSPVLNTYNDRECKVWDAMTAKIHDVDDNGIVVMEAPLGMKIKVKITCDNRNGARKQLIWTDGNTDVQVTGMFLLGEMYVTIWTSDGSARTVELSLSKLDFDNRQPIVKTTPEAQECKRTTSIAAGLHHQLPVMQEFMDTECKTWDAMISRFNDADAMTARLNGAGVEGITLMEASNGMKLQVRMNDETNDDAGKQLVWAGNGAVAEVSGLFLMGQFLTIWTSDGSGQGVVLATGKFVKCSLGRWHLVTREITEEDAN